MGNHFCSSGDCAESFAEFHANNIRDTFKVMLQNVGCSLLTQGNVLFVKVGRMRWAVPNEICRLRSDRWCELPIIAVIIINGLILMEKS